MKTLFHRGAGNIARSRLSGGSLFVSARPRKFFGCGRQPRLDRILPNISPKTIKLRIGPDQMVVTLLLPKCPMRAQQRVSLVSGKSLERTQPLCGRHVRGDQQMNMIRHHDKRMELIPVQLPFAVPQRSHHHLRNLRPPKEQPAIRACVQKPVNCHERLSRRDQSFRWEYPVRRKASMQPECDKQSLLDYVPVGQPPFIMPHTCFLWLEAGETLTEFVGRPILAAAAFQAAKPAKSRLRAILPAPQESGW